MNATDFIKQMMDKISSSVEGISIKYAFERSTGFHIVEVSPESIRTENRIYRKLAHQCRVDFHKEFPIEDIIISRVNEFHDMSNVIYEKQSTTAKSVQSCSLLLSFREFTKEDIVIPKVSGSLLCTTDTSAVAYSFPSFQCEYDDMNLLLAA